MNQSSPTPIKAGKLLFPLLAAVLALFSTLLTSCGDMSPAKVRDAAQAARVAKAKSDLNMIALGLEQYQEAAGEYPTAEQGLKALTEHLPEIPKDPWKRDYHYTQENEGFSLWSTGPSEEDEADDIRFVPQE